MVLNSSTCYFSIKAFDYPSNLKESLVGKVFLVVGFSISLISGLQFLLKKWAAIFWTNILPHFLPTVYMSYFTSPLLFPTHSTRPLFLFLIYLPDLHQHHTQTAMLMYISISINRRCNLSCVQWKWGRARLKFEPLETLFFTANIEYLMLCPNFLISQDLF